MSRKNRATLSAVEKLIEQRRQFQDWTAKLDKDVEGMPSHVVSRVRNDYATRLDAVMRELSEHQDQLQQSLADSRERLGELEAQQQARRDELAELRLRQRVGELEDRQFEETSGGLKAALEGLAREIGSSEKDIERLEEILDVIAAPAEPEPEPVRPAARAPEPSAPRHSGPVAAPVEHGSPRPPAPEKKAPQVDELAFLRSMTVAQQAVKLPPRPSPRAPEPDVPESEPDVPAGEPPSVAAAPAADAALAARASEEGINAAPGLVTLSAEVPETTAAAAAAGARAKEQAREKTIICKECSAPNLPTEWYCEKCGAELSAL